MSFLKNLFSGGSKKPEKKYYVFQVKCKRCGEIIEGRVDLDNDLSVEYEDNHNVYFGRKVLMGNNICFQQIEVEMKFTPDRQLIDREVKGGTFVD
jgi:lysyl-tRNA synthetase class I